MEAVRFLDEAAPLPLWMAGRSGVDGTSIDSIIGAASISPTGGLIDWGSWEMG